MTPSLICNDNAHLLRGHNSVESFRGLFLIPQNALYIFMGVTAPSIHTPCICRSLTFQSQTSAQISTLRSKTSLELVLKFTAVSSQ